MAIQPVDRKNAKHNLKVAPRKAPSMVNRSNKRVFAELAPLHVRLSQRIQYDNRWWHFDLCS